MLRKDDLARFQDHFERAVIDGQPPADPAGILKEPNGLFGEEIQQLVRSLEIAAILGGADRREAIAVGLIARRVRGVRCIDLNQSARWERAIAWALSQPELAELGDDSRNFSDRSEQVGQACRRLRDKGYQISIDAFGISVSEQSQRAIFNVIDGLTAHLGGTEVAMQVCRIIEDGHLIYDGMWLLGDLVPSIWNAKRPAFPVGWLFSLGLRHLGRGGRARSPAVAWKTITELASDFAAAMDCQRYCQYEEIDIHPANSWRVLRDSLLWREIFALPQVPPQVLPSLREALSALITTDEERLFDWRLEPAFDELDDLLSRSVNHKLTIHSRLAIARSYPNLWKIGVGEIGQVNNTYNNPTVGGSRNQSNFIFLACAKDSLLTLPAPLLREAFCQAVFTQIWTKLTPSRASDIVGRIFERSLEQACHGKTASVHASAKYSIGTQTFEIDVGTRDCDRIVLFEAKAKSLTTQARSGDMMAFYADYTDSYLAIVRQLVRHEDNLRQGLTPLTMIDEDCSDFRPLKVAVSPLSYGPVSDKMLASGLLRSFVNVSLQPLSSDAIAKKTTDSFNKVVRQIYDVVFKLAPKTKENQSNLFAYFVDVFWLDLGQALYALDRANTVVDAFRPLQFVTFATRDFWTEVALADTQGLTKNHWRQLAN